MKIPDSLNTIVAGILFVSSVAFIIIGANFCNSLFFVAESILVGVLFAFGSSIMVSTGLDILVDVIRDVPKEDNVARILHDFPLFDTPGSTEHLEARILRRTLILDEEIRMLKALKKTLDERPKHEE